MVPCGAGLQGATLSSRVAGDASEKCDANLISSSYMKV